jgi:hypothetical protein
MVLMPVFISVAVTTALGIDAPLESRTVPVTVAVSTCAHVARLERW